MAYREHQPHFQNNVAGIVVHYPLAQRAPCAVSTTKYFVHILKEDIVLSPNPVLFLSYLVFFKLRLSQQTTCFRTITGELRGRKVVPPIPHSRWQTRCWQAPINKLSTQPFGMEKPIWCSMSLPLVSGTVGHMFTEKWIGEGRDPRFWMIIFVAQDGLSHA